jgi:hypothetical protein
MTLPATISMRASIPDSITREDVLAGIDAFEAKAEQDFADSISYDLLHEGKRGAQRFGVGPIWQFVLAILMS